VIIPASPAPAARRFRFPLLSHALQSGSDVLPGESAASTAAVVVTGQPLASRKNLILFFVHHSPPRAPSPSGDVDRTLTTYPFNQQAPDKSGTSGKNRTLAAMTEIVQGWR
jgi:hypothetical protein